jgi:hypothetical protein
VRLLRDNPLKFRTGPIKRTFPPVIAPAASQAEEAPNDQADTNGPYLNQMPSSVAKMVQATYSRDAAAVASGLDHLTQEAEYTKLQGMDTLQSKNDLYYVYKYSTATRYAEVDTRAWRRHQSYQADLPHEEDAALLSRVHQQEDEHGQLHLDQQQEDERVLEGNHSPSGTASNSVVRTGVTKTCPTGLADAAAAKRTPSKEDQPAMGTAEMPPVTNKGKVDRNV